MAQTLYELLNDCVVQVDAPANSSRGTGFFVASGLILTCAHVIETNQTANTSIEITWHGQTYPASILEKTQVNGSDLALLQVPITEHPCVLLQGGAEPFNNLYSYGYPDLYANGASTIFKSEGWEGGQSENIKFQSGQVRPGMSGSPILNLETGCACGIIQWTRDKNAPYGGLGLLAPNIYQALPNLETQCKQFHQHDTRWLDLMTLQQRQRIRQLWQLPVSDKDSIKVYFSYALKDEELCKELGKQLKIMQRLGMITSSYGKDIDAGQALQEAKDQLNQASIILLLISPDFIESDYNYDEMELALKRHQAGMARVIPIILRSTLGWEQTELGKLMAIPRNGKPVANWKPRDEGFYEVAKEIRRVVEHLRKP